MSFGFGLSVAHRSSGGGAGGGGNGNDYAAVGRDYNGAKFQSRTTALAATADNTAGIISAWVRPTAFAADQTVLALMDSGLTGGQRLYVNTSSKIRLQVSNAAGSSSINSETNAVTANKWHHVLFSWRVTPSLSMLGYGDDVSLAANSFANSNTTVADIVSLVSNYFGERPNGAEKFTGCIAEVFYHNVYLDITVLANRRKFIDGNGKPVSLGATGALPLGVQPLLYTPVGDLSSNSGSAAAFSQGAVAPTVCSTSIIVGT